MTRHVHSMPFGASLLPDGGGAKFRLWAPGAWNVCLTTFHTSDVRRHELVTSADGWWEVDVASAVPGDRYQWAVRCDPVGEEIAVPDPASRNNPGGVFPPSLLEDPHAFDWEDDAWRGRPWTEAVLYELHVGTFTPEGSFAAAEARLSELRDLGVTVVQLMPVASFPGRFGWGYDGVLPFAPQASYGPPASLKRFVQTAHRLGLMVMLDVVYNHFGPSGNFLRLYAPQFFSERHHNVWGDALNFDGPGSAVVREFFVHNALYWIKEFRLDGLRLDAVHAMRDDSAPDILEQIASRVHEEVTDRTVHLVLENDVNDEQRLRRGSEADRYDAQWSGDFHHALHVLLTGEREGYYAEYADAPLSHLARTLSRGFSRTGEPHLASAAQHAADPRRDADVAVPLTATVNFLQNHDQVGNRAFGDRLVTLVDEAPLRLATALLLLSPAVPMLLMGEEWGARSPFLYFADWTGELRDAVVSGRRREFAQFSAFADEAAREHIPDPCSVQTFERCRLDRKAGASDAVNLRWLEFHRTLLSLRRTQLVPRLPALCVTSHPVVFLRGSVMLAQWQFTDGSTLCAVANLGAAPVAVDTATLPEGAAPWHTLGTVAPGELGPWSGQWWWSGGEETPQ